MDEFQSRTLQQNAEWKLTTSSNKYVILDGKDLP